eukprot:6023294-Prymnesium_polylepis.1
MGRGRSGAHSGWGAKGTAGARGAVWPRLRRKRRACAPPVRRAARAHEGDARASGTGAPHGRRGKRPCCGRRRRVSGGARVWTLTVGHSDARACDANLALADSRSRAAFSTRECAFCASSLAMRSRLCARSVASFSSTSCACASCSAIPVIRSSYCSCSAAVRLPRLAGPASGPRPTSELPPGPVPVADAGRPSPYAPFGLVADCRDWNDGSGISAMSLVLTCALCGRCLRRVLPAREGVEVDDTMPFTLGSSFSASRSSFSP